MRPTTHSATGFGFRWAVAALVALATLSVSVMAADPQLVGVLALLDEPAVAKQLGLSEKQQADLIKVIDKHEFEALNFKDLKPEDRDAKLSDLRTRAEIEGLRLLNPDQKAKLRQVRDARRAAGETAPSAAAPTPARSTTAVAQADGGDEPPKATTEAPSETADEQGDATKQPAEGNQPETTKPDVAKPEASKPDQPAVAAPDRRDSRDAPARTTAPPAVNHTVREPLPVEPLDPDGKIRFKFRYQPWDSVLDWFARVNGYSLFMETPPSGTFNYTDDEGYTPVEAIDLLNSYLLTKGMVIIRNRKMLMVVRTDEVPSILVPYVQEDELDKHGEYELVRTLFALERSSPDDIEAEIRPMLGPQGSIVKLTKAKRLQVVETAGRLRAIRKVIQGIENPPPSTDDKLHWIELKHIKADQAIPPIQQHFQMAPGTMIAPDGSLRLLLEPVSGRLFASGKQEQRNKLTELIKVLDQPNPNGETGPREEPQFEVYTISVADSQQVLAVLQTFMAGQPDVRLSADPKTGHINALARPSQHRTIKALIDQMQSDGRQIEVVHLRYVDPDLAVLMIGKLYAAEANPANAPIVDADPLNKRLVIRASKAQLEQIRDLLAKMGETATSDDATMLASGKGPVRVLQMSPRQARSIIGEIEPFWNLNRTNKIRIVAPAAGTPDRSLPPPNSRRSDPADELESLFRRELFPEDSNTSQPVLEPRTIRKYQSGEEFIPPTAPPSDRSTHYAPSLDRIRIVRVNLAPGEHTGGNASNRARVRFVSQPSDAPEAPAPRAETPPAAQPATKPETPATAPEPKPATDEAPKSIKGADIIVKVTPGGLVIASDDLEALDDFEDMVNQFLDTTTSGGREFTVFYLQYIKAEHAKTLLDEVLQGGGGDTGGGGSLFGDIAGAALGGGGGLLGGLLGGAGDTLGGSSSLTIVADPRQNSLIVQGASTDIDTVEQLLQVIDRQDTGIADKRLQDEPRFIPVYNNPAADIAETVKLVYADRINVGGNAQQQQQRQPSPEEFIRMLRGGGGRGGRGGRGGSNGGEGIDRNDIEKVSVNVDTRSNSLIVVAPDYVFNDIKSLVQTLDSVSAASQQHSVVYSPKNSSAQAIQQVLVATYGDKVVTGSSTTPRSSTQPSSQNTAASPPGPQNFGQQPQPPSFQPGQIPFGGFPFGGPFGGRGFDGGGDRGGRSFDGGGDRGGRGGRSFDGGGDRGGRGGRRGG
ncbi:MAG: hypothetical protein DCC68_22975 [Planctomycetota bacterium]|nr:MAG: hypothetical protein DCC68_22975 [Planctomycetota bacterium]